jgi:hypothetical protein
LHAAGSEHPGQLGFGAQASRDELVVRQARAWAGTLAAYVINQWTFSLGIMGLVGSEWIRDRARGGNHQFTYNSRGDGIGKVAIVIASNGVPSAGTK